MLVHASFALLPLSGPEPSLVSRHRDLRTQLDHSIVTLHDFDLSTWSIEVVAPPEIGRKHDLTPPTDTYERSLAHMANGSGITVIQYFRPRPMRRINRAPFIQPSAIQTCTKKCPRRESNPRP